MSKKNTQSLFAAAEPTEAVRGGRQLSMTAQLTTIANNKAVDVIRTVIEDQEKYGALVVDSQQSSSAQDQLINELGELQTVDLEFLKAADEEELERMLKSQQSKRSRSKSKAMTEDNYKALLSAAIAEQLIRTAMGKPKNASGNVAGDPRFSDAQLEELASDYENLQRAIRNIQSKKSIAKSKVDFDPESERWAQLLEAEKQLKELRGQVSGTVAKESQKAVEVNKQLEEMIGDGDLDKMSAKEAKELLAKAKEMLASK